MAEIFVNDILKCQVWCADSEQASVNTTYYRVLTIVGSPTTANVAVAFDTVMAAAYIPLLNNLSGYLGIQVGNVTQVPLQSPSGISNPNVGTGGAIAAPRQSAPMIKFVTGFAGPKGRGRIYIPFMSTSGLTGNGILTSTYQSDLTDLKTAMSTFTSFSDGGNSGTLEQVLYHRATKLGTRITEWSFVDKVATQKRRGAYGRPNNSPV